METWSQEVGEHQQILRVVVKLLGVQGGFGQHGLGGLQGGLRLLLRLPLRRQLLRFLPHATTLWVTWSLQGTMHDGIAAG